eukprot:Tbor_TRINITY_DN5463_c1_g6::TRINITY_DN5463_c1_g6_i1::g.25060::m.25060
MDYFLDGLIKPEDENTPPTSNWNSPSCTRTSVGTSREHSTGSIMTSVTNLTAITTTTGRKQVQDLLLAVELKEHQLKEMEESLASIGKQSAFNEGKLKHKLEDQSHELESLKCNNEVLQTKYAEQSNQIQLLSEQLRLIREEMKTTQEKEVSKIKEQVEAETNKMREETALRDAEKELLLQKLETERLKCQLLEEQQKRAEQERKIQEAEQDSKKMTQKNGKNWERCTVM